MQFSKVYPKPCDWSATLTPSCGISISDPTTNVDIASIEYRISTNNGSNWTYWSKNDLNIGTDSWGVYCSINPLLNEGDNNLIQWRAKDIVGNPYNFSIENRVVIDISNVSFSNPTPSIDELQRNLTVICGITISDNLSGVKADSIEFSTSTNGIWEFNDWQSAGKNVDGKIIHCKVNPNFGEGANNFIRWRAKDVVGNGYHVSDNYQIKIKLNKPPSTLLVAPENNSIVYTLTPKLIWEGSDPNNDSKIIYNIFLSHDEYNIYTLNESSLIKSTVNNNEYSLETPLVDGITYYWTVIPNDGFLNGSCLSNYWKFIVDTTIDIPVVTLIEPTNNTNITTITPKLSWMLSYINSSIVTYNIYVAKFPFNGELISDDHIFQSDYKLTTYIFDKPLIRGETYYWSIIPWANHPAGKVRGFCSSGIWKFKVELPIEYDYNLSLELESPVLTIEQGDYVITNITIINYGDIDDTFSFDVDKGILNANIALKDSIKKILIKKNQQITLPLEIMISPVATPRNYSIYITVSSDGAKSVEKDVSVTKMITFEIIEKKIEQIDGKENQVGFWEIIIGFIITLLILIVFAISIFIYRTKKAKKIPLVKAELLQKLPEQLTLPRTEPQIKDGSILPSNEVKTPTLDSKAMPTQYQLPRAILTKKQELKLLREKFLLGDIDKDTYKEMKAEIESTEDEPELDDEGSERIDLEAKLPEDREIDESSTLEEIDKLNQEVMPLETEEMEEMEELEELEELDLVDIEEGYESPLVEPVDENELHDIPEEVQVFPDDGLCITCGELLDQDVAYCWKCGTKYENK